MLKRICEETKSIINIGDGLAGFSGNLPCQDDAWIDIGCNLLLPYLVLGVVCIAYTVKFFGSTINNVVSFDL